MIADHKKLDVEGPAFEMLYSEDRVAGSTSEQLEAALSVLS